MLLVGTKSDLAATREVFAADAQTFADSLRVPFLETSAKDASNVEKAFVSMATAIKARMASEVPEARANVTLSAATTASTSSCCY